MVDHGRSPATGLGIEKEEVRPKCGFRRLGAILRGLRQRRIGHAVLGAPATGQGTDDVTRGDEVLPAFLFDGESGPRLKVHL